MLHVSDNTVKEEDTGMKVNWRHMALIGKNVN